ncbi:MAG TPA: PP2C family protein-serine/threonine phosphatase [Candidatus Krumholzibacteriaceae bacterium]|nr:PP2C family protein-serine/threonine phosphatase [Candidatus Krumholzibacteriaceae bacterium]
MPDGQFKPKEFYRKLDSLIVRIKKRVGTEDALALVLEELVEEVGSELKIKSGCIYKLRMGYFRRIGGALGDATDSWPELISRYEPFLQFVSRHKSYIFFDSEIPPWGNNSVAAFIGEDDQFLIIFRLNEGWERETLQFSINVIQNILNFSRSTSRFTADLQEAYEIQRSLLPRFKVDFEGYDAAARSIPAERVGGDYYDYGKLDEDVLSFSIGDASGHGLPAALLVRDIVTGLRMGIEKDMKISAVVRKLNRVIGQSRLSTRFVSIFLSELEEKGTLVYVNAGHPPPILIKESAEERLTRGGSILGPMENAVFERGFAFMDPGDILVMFTDGILESMNSKGEMFGEERVIKYVRENKGKPAEVIVGGMFDYIYEFRNEDKLLDDATLFIIKKD